MTSPQRPRALIITDDHLGERMAGPAIRAVEIARHLADAQPVTLVSASGGHVDVPGVDCPSPGTDMEELVRRSEVVVLQGAVLVKHPWLHDSPVPLVVDLYDPFHLEALQLDESDALRSVDVVESTLWTLADQIARGDFFLCATERQRDFWLGHLAGQGRLNHRTRAGDPDARRLIDLVPFGVPSDDPTPAGRTLRTLVPAVGPDDIVALWAGGIYDWFDPVTLVDAVATADRSLHVVFLGGAHPNPDVPEMRAAAEARAHAAALGVAGTRVHFVDEWIPYAERVQLLLDADIGVTTHRPGLETAFSFRTRILDYLWVGLPVVCNTGDDLSAAIQDAGAGRVVVPQVVDDLREALDALVADAAFRRRAGDAARQLGRSYRWSEVVEPLRRFTIDPHPAADRVDPVTAAALAAHRPPARRGLRHLLGRVRLNLAAGGWRRVATSVDQRLRRRS